MNETFPRRVSALWQAEFLSPKDLLRRAIVITILYGVVELAGLRDFTSILNGTMGSLDMSWRLSAFLGLGYIFAYLAFVLLVPILVIAAVILIFWGKISRRMEQGVTGNSSLSPGEEDGIWQDEPRTKAL